MLSRNARSLRRALAAVCLFTLVGLQLPFPSTASAQTSKEDRHFQLNELLQQISQTKERLADSPGNVKLQTKLNNLLQQYDTISASLGGDKGVEADYAPALAGAVAAPPPAPSGCTSATTNFTNNTPVGIVDNTAVTSTITVSGVNTYLWDVDLT